MTILVVLLVLHTLDGREIDINPQKITSMREAKADDKSGKYFTEGVRCMVNLSDGKFVSVIETCAQIRALLKGVTKNDLQ